MIHRDNPTSQKTTSTIEQISLLIRVVPFKTACSYSKEHSFFLHCVFLITSQILEKQQNNKQYEYSSDTLLHYNTADSEAYFIYHLVFYIVFIIDSDNLASKSILLMLLKVVLFIRLIEQNSVTDIIHNIHFSYIVFMIIEIPALPYTSKIASWLILFMQAQSYVFREQEQL